MIHKDLPLIDLHRHLDGSVRLETVLDLGLKHDLPLPAKDLESLRLFVQVTEPQPGILAFLEKFEWQVGVLVDYDACRRIAYENVLDAENEGIDYIELRFSPWFVAEAHNLDPSGVIEAIAAGVQEGREAVSKTRVNLIGILSRTYGEEITMKELDALIIHKDKFVALDLAGDEANYPAELFVEHFKKARDVGLDITVHAGEAAGAESVWNAIKLLGATRIGHAIHIDEDPALIDYMLEHKIGIEANLTSNYQTSTVESLASHPLKNWLDKGLLATINSDDPGISNIDLPHEFNYAAKEAGLTNADTRKAQENAFEIAFLSEEDRNFLD